MNKISKNKSPWAWIPTLYYAEGIPYVVVMIVSVIMYKRLGISNTDIALYTSWLYLPWVIKPLWSPIVDLLKTKRFWIITMQLLIGAGLAGVALTIPGPNFFKYTLAFLWLLAFSSATHDIAADGFYMLGLSKHHQAYFVGIRSTFYRLAMITGQGLLIIVAGYLESSTGLGQIELNVKTTNSSFVQETLDKNSISGLEGELRLLHYPEELTISTNQLSKIEYDSLQNFVETENNVNGYLIKSGAKAIAKENVESKSWWNEVVVDNLEDFITSNFGRTVVPKSTSTKIGNVGLAYFYLSKEPAQDEEIVLNLSQNSGDKSIKLLKGSRFVFTKENWNKPAVALFQIDPKLKTESSASFQAISGNIPLAWTITFSILTIMFFIFFVYHKFMLPHPASDVSTQGKDANVFGEFFTTFVLFFKRKNIGIIIAFLLFYRLGESQLVKLASPFLLDAREVGGLALTTGEVGFVYGTIGVLSLVIGGLLGGFLAAKHGLKHWLWYMLVAINLPNAVYIYLSYALPESFIAVLASVAVEQFGYGFGFTAYMLYMIYVSDGEHKTAHFAITTGFMALGMMIPGMISGWLQELVGYQHFFIWVIIATIPAFIITKFIPLDAEFGKEVIEAE
ncbi:MAG: AmpG family muropeptide MFS transporter [Ignavibacteriae bacterium]|nr:AmpG family muropeptide MFS transporter [Ignavibacteriota bacterium]